MNTRIGTSFGLALLTAIAVIATMFALGMFSAKEASAGHVTTNAPHVIAMTPSSSSVNAKASWTITVGVSGTALAAGTGTIAITFPSGVVLPTTIDKSRVSVGGDTANDGTFGLDPLTSDPTISGQTVTLTVPAIGPGGNNLQNTIVGGDQARIFFSQLAGIVNPAKSGAAGSVSAGTAGKINTSSQGTNGNIPTALSFNRTISLGGKTSQVEGGAVTVTVGGFTPNLAVTLSGSVSGSGVVGSDRKAVISGTKKNTGTTVTATDTAGLTATSGTISLKAELSATASGKAGDTITLTGKNYTGGGNIPGFGSITFGGTAMIAGQMVTTALKTTSASHTDKDADGNLDDFSVKVTIPSNAKKGVNQVKVVGSGTTSGATANVEVEGRSVTIDPDSGPPGTTVTVTGSGFPASRTSNTNNTSAISPAFGSSTVTGLFTDGSGNLPGSGQFTIPSSATSSVITLTVSIQGADGLAATGSDKFTVTSRVLTVTPTSGPRGTKVLVTGAKFTTSSGTVDADSITVDSKTTTHALANITSSGDVPSISLSIPSNAGIGSKTISLTDSGSLTGTTKFTVTVPTITVGLASATMGQSVPITGEGWVPDSSVTISLKKGATTVTTKVATANGAGAIDTSIDIPSTVGVGAQTVTFTAADASTYNNTATAQTLKIPKPTVTLSDGEANIGDVVEVVATGFPPQSGLSILTVGGADVRSGVVTSDAEGGLTTSFIVPGVTGSNIVSVKIGANTVSTSISVLKAAGTAAAATTAPAEIFADVIANSDNLVRVWRFDNATQGWEFYDPRPAFSSANTLAKSGAGDIVWVNVTAEQAFQSTTLFPGWNLISLD